MKINATKRILEKLDELMSMTQIDGLLNDAVTNTIQLNTVIPEDIEELRMLGNRFVIDGRKMGLKLDSVEKAMLVIVIRDLLKPYFERGMMEGLLAVLTDQCRVFWAKDFEEDAYLKNIDFSRGEKGDFILQYQKYDPWELFIYDVPDRLKGTIMDIPKVGCFAEKYRYPSICQKSIESTWMSVTPNEIYTMKTPIQNAKGKVLTLGCGMGYFAYMASRKEDVESVTIVEKEQNVIDLFEELILPQFETRDKISIMKADAIEYMESLEDGVYDYCFADIWLGLDHIEPYMAIKQIGKRFKKTKMEYWIEKSFGTYFTKYAGIEICESFCNDHDDQPIPPPEEFGMTEAKKRNIQYIHKLLENETVTKPEHIDYYMDPKNLLSLIGKTSVVY